MDCVLHWNLQSLHTKFSDLKLLLHDFTPAVVCLQETLCSTRPVHPPSGFSIFHSLPARRDGHERGAAILVDKRVHCIAFPLRTSLQAVAVRVWLGKWYTICSLYLPHSSLSLREVTDLLDQLHSPYLLLGDMNAKSPLWGATNTDNFGRIFESVLLSHPISLLTDGTPTHFHSQTGTYSTIDLSFCSSACTTDFTYRVTENLRGSDHYPVCLALVSPPPPLSRPKRFVETRADWDIFHARSETVVVGGSQGSSIDDDVASITEILVASASASMPLSTGVSARRPVPWWNDECRAAFRARLRAERALRRQHTVMNVVTFQKLRATCRVVFRRAKKKSWQDFLSSINSRTSLHKIWKKVQKISGKFSPSPPPVLRAPDGSNIVDPFAVATLIAEAFASVSHPDNYNLAFRRFRRAAVTRPLAFHDGKIYSYNSPFTLSELRHALSQSSNSSPGLDQITYTMIRHAHPTLVQALLQLFNRIFLENLFPETWRTAVVVPLPKEGKDNGNPLHFRPIALTSCLCKLLEKMVNFRLMAYLESHQLLGRVQSGFRSNRSTTDNLVQFEHHIFSAFERRHHTIAVFFDLTKAYDMAWRWGIMERLHVFGLRGHLPLFVENFLSRRYIRVRVGSHLSESVEVLEGTPQGSVLSCTCFLLAMHTIADGLPQNVQSSLYVDDFTIYASGSSCRFVERTLQNAISRLERWCGTTGFCFSAEKTRCMHICRVRGCPHTAHNLSLFGTPITPVQEYKYLGVYVDEKLNWNRHIVHLRRSSSATLSLFRHLTSKTWGADTQSLLRLYVMLLKPRLDYGSEVYSTSPRVDSLSPVQNEVLRVATGAFRSSPIPSLLAVTGLLPLPHYRVIKHLNTFLRLASSPTHPLHQDLFNMDLTRLDALVDLSQRLPRVSFIARGHLLCDLLQINIRQVLPDLLPLFPLWPSGPPTVCSTLFTSIKSQLPSEVLRVTFVDHAQCHNRSYKFYTDGTKTPDGVAFAALGSDGWNVSQRISADASIFTAELLAVRASIFHCRDIPGDCVTIFSDSRSAIMALKGHGSKNALVCQIQRHMAGLRQQITLCWVPSHVGVPGNEACDRAARQALLQPDVARICLPRSDLKNLVKQRVRESWRIAWRDLPDNKLRYFLTVPSLSSVSPSSRQWDIHLTRLRIGHSLLTHGFLMERGPLPYCHDCIVPLTVRHILAECPSLSDERRLCFGAAATMRYMLIDCDVSLAGPLYRFTRSIGLLPYL